MMAEIHFLPHGTVYHISSVSLRLQSYAYSLLPQRSIHRSVARYFCAARRLHPRPHGDDSRTFAFHLLACASAVEPLR